MSACKIRRRHTTDTNKKSKNQVWKLNINVFNMFFCLYTYPVCFQLTINKQVCHQERGNICFVTRKICIPMIVSMISLCISIFEFALVKFIAVWPWKLIVKNRKRMHFLKVNRKWNFSSAASRTTKFGSNR